MRHIHHRPGGRQKSGNHKHGNFSYEASQRPITARPLRFVPIAIMYRPNTVRVSTNCPQNHRPNRNPERQLQSQQPRIRDDPHPAADVRAARPGNQMRRPPRNLQHAQRHDKRRNRPSHRHRPVESPAQQSNRQRPPPPPPAAASGASASLSTRQSLPHTIPIPTPPIRSGSRRSPAHTSSRRPPAPSAESGFATNTNVVVAEKNRLVVTPNANIKIASTASNPSRSPTALHQLRSDFMRLRRHLFCVTTPIAL